MGNIHGKRDMSNVTKLTISLKKDVLDTFRQKCKNEGFQMSSVIESFLREYNDGEYVIRVVKKRRIREE